MAWTNITKPTIDSWTDVSKPSESSVVTLTNDAQPLGLLIAITVPSFDTSVTSGWADISKPISSVWSFIAKPTS